MEMANCVHVLQVLAKRNRAAIRVMRLQRGRQADLTTSNDRAGECLLSDRTLPARILSARPQPQGGNSMITGGMHGPRTRLWLTSFGLTGLITSLSIVGFATPTEAVQNSFASPPEHQSWVIEKTPQIVEESSLENATSCTSSTLCLGVGSYLNQTGLEEPLAGEWRGGSWSYQTFGPPGSVENIPDGAEFTGMSCISPTACLAVGWMGFGGSEPVFSLTAKWNGSTWTWNSPPAGENGGPTNPYDLSAVSCVAKWYCTAVGSAQPSNGPEQPLVETLSGKTWSTEATPTQSSNASFSGVSCTSETSCTAVGTSGGAPLAEIWNGTDWTVRTPPSPSGSTSSALSSVWCSSSSACVAVGSYTASPEGDGFAELWNGTVWKLETTPVPVGTTSADFTGVSCASITQCEAVGNYTTSSGSQTFSDGWNGASWSTQPVPQPGKGNEPMLQGVSCLSGSSDFV